MQNAIVTCVVSLALLQLQLPTPPGAVVGMKVGDSLTYTITACIDDTETLWIDGQILQWAVYQGSPIGRDNGSGNGNDCRNPGVNNRATIEILTAFANPGIGHQAGDVTYSWVPTYNQQLRAFDNPAALASDLYNLPSGAFPVDPQNYSYQIQEILDRGPVTMYCPSQAKACTTTGGPDPQGGKPVALIYSGTPDYLHFNFHDAGTGAVQYRIVVKVTKLQ